MPKPYLTPPDLPLGETCRTLKIPSSKYWLGVFNSALLTMVNEYNWEQVHETDLTVEETINIVQALIQEFWDTAGCNNCTLPGGGKIIRININGYFEELGEDGEWNAPTGDYAVPAVPARSGGTPDEQKCLAAANAANVLQQLYEQVSDDFGEGLSAAQAITNLLLLIGGIIAAPFALLGAAVLAIATILFNEFFEAMAFVTADLWDENFTSALQCYLYECSSNSAGVVTFDMGCVQQKLADQSLNPFDLTASQFRLFSQLAYLFSIIGVEGLNTAGATTAIEDADCSECEQTWCYEVDLTVVDGGFDPVYAGVWSAGVGWMAENKVIGTQRTIVEGSFPFDFSVHLTDVGFIYNWQAGAVNAGVVGIGAWVNNFSEQFVNIAMNSVVEGDGEQLNFEVDLDTGASLDFDLQCSHESYGGSAALVAVTIHGTGDAPTFLEGMGWTAC